MRTSLRLTPEPLTAETFAEYGQVLEIPGVAGRRDFAARVTNSRVSAKPNLALVRVEPTALPLNIDTIECHPASSQAFVPLDGGRYLVVVMSQKPDGSPAPAHARAFLATDVGMTVLDRPTTSAC